MSRLNGRTAGAAIRKKREARGLSLRALARAVDISPTWLSMIEQGRGTPSKARAAMINKALARRRPEEKR